MAYDLTIFGRLMEQAGYNQTALLNKFPFLCDLEALSRTLKGHVIVTDPQQNPNGYTNTEMAWQIIHWFDRYADYPTGKIPFVMQGQVNNGLKWNQTSFWYLAGIYDVDQDPGHEVGSISFSGKYYNTAENITFETPTSEGGYWNPVIATAQHIIHDYGPIDYVRRLDDGEGQIYVSNVSSDDLYSIFWDKTVNGTTTDTTGASVTFKDTFPFTMQDENETYLGYGVRPPAIPTPNGTTQGLNNLLSGPSAPNLAEHASLMFKADVKITSKTQTLATGGVAPKYSMIVPSSGWLVIDPTTSEEFVPVQNLFEANGNRPFTGTELFHRIALVENPDVYYSDITTMPWNNSLFSPYGTNDTRLKFICAPDKTLRFDTRTATRGTGYYQFKGYPIYPMKLEYSTAADPTTMLYKVVYVAFNHLKNWNMYLYDAIVSVNSTGSKVIGNSSFVCGTDGVGGPAVSFVGQQTYKDSHVTLTENGVGYPSQYDFPSITISGGVWGRYGSSRRDWGKQVRGRVDEDVIGTPMSTRLNVTINNMNRLKRNVYTIANSWEYYQKSSKNSQRPWFGTDNRYVNGDYGSVVTLTGNKVTGVNGGTVFVDYTPGNVFEAACPGFVYNTNYYHHINNENGYLYAYTIGTQIAGQQKPTDFNDFLNDPIWWNKSSAVYNVVITDGKVTALTPISRPDGDGTFMTGGWDYYSDHNNRALYFVPNGGFAPAGQVAAPKAYYYVNGTSVNGNGNKVAVDLNHPDFFEGFSLPNDAYLYAIAMRSTEISPTYSFDTYYNLDGNGPDTANARELFPGFYPAAIKITSERPVLRSTTRSLIENVRSTGAQRYSFTYTYPPMTKDEAQELVASFEQYRSGEKAFNIRLPKRGFNILPEYKYDTRYSSYMQIIGGGNVGSVEVKVDGLPPDTQNALEAGTYFTVNGDTKLYQIVRNANSNAYGQAVIRIEPGFKKDNSFATLYTNTPDYLLVAVRFADDAMSYTTDGSGLYTLEFNFVEALA